MVDRNTPAILQIEVGGEIQFKRPLEHCLSFVMCPRSGFKRRCFVGCPMLSVDQSDEPVVKFCSRSSNWVKVIVKDLRVKDDVIETLIEDNKPKIEVTRRYRPNLDILDAFRAPDEPTPPMTAQREPVTEATDNQIF